MVERRVTLNPLLPGFFGFSRNASMWGLDANPDAVGHFFSFKGVRWVENMFWGLGYRIQVFLVFMEGRKSLPHSTGTLCTSRWRS